MRARQRKKNARKAIQERLKEALFSGDDDYGIEKIAEILAEKLCDDIDKEQRKFYTRFTCKACAKGTNKETGCIDPRCPNHAYQKEMKALFEKEYSPC